MENRGDLVDFWWPLVAEQGCVPAGPVEAAANKLPPCALGRAPLKQQQSGLEPVWLLEET